MKHSIRLRLFTAMGSLILFYVALSWLLNNFVLDKYYFYNKKNTLIESYNLINNIYKNDVESISLELEKLEHTKDLHIVILNSNYEVIYDTVPRKVFLRTKSSRHADVSRRYNPIENRIRLKEPEIVQKGLVIENRKDDRLNLSFISLYSVLNNRNFIFLSAPVAAIQESVDITNKFYLFTGIITIITGSILVFLLAKRFTKPILELKEIAEKMAKLDFSKRYPVRSNDEIGQLGHSINSLSEQLQDSITELKKANERLRKDIEKERKIDEMRKEFLSSASHELKTPIALIQGYAEGLKMNVNEDEENKNFYCDVIIDEAHKMNKLVKQLLELSHLESGEVRLERTDFNVIQLVRKVLKKNDLVIKNRNINLKVEGEKDIMVIADPDKIEQVLVNYLNNAVNHVDNKKIVKVTIKQTGRKVRVIVFNSGQHIPEDCVDKIWASFYKIDKSRTRAYGGTGLGLSIVKAIQEAHHNKFGVNNVKGGVEFWFELDLAKSSKL